MKTRMQWLMISLVLFMSVLIFSCSKNPAEPDKASNTNPVSVVPTVTPMATAGPTATATPTAVTSPTITPTPATSGSFQNFEDNNGTPQGVAGNYFWQVWESICAFETTIVHGGLKSVKMTARATADLGPGQHGGTLGINSAAALTLDLTGATNIYIWVYDTQGANTIQVKLRDHRSDGSEMVSDPVYSPASAVKNTWTKIAISKSSFNKVDFSKIKNMEIYEWNDGVYYFDDAGWE